MRTEKLLLSSDGTKMFLGGKGASTASLPELPGVYPNPSKGEVYVTYSLPEGAEQGQLEVRDLLGRILHTERLAQGGGIVDLSHLRTPPGTLALILYADGIRMATTKLIVVR
ncbi:MAG: T9SS type A sorting domain-containing protein [Flavobacteriales bacterium]|nr:T9SS type A sorting domain-containing protein [Flavobacteriales bacterium]